MDTLLLIAVIAGSALSLAILIVWVVFPFRVISRLDKIKRELEEANFLKHREQSKTINKSY
jgi:hypothetical protein